MNKIKRQSTDPIKAEDILIRSLPQKPITKMDFLTCGESRAAANTCLCKQKEKIQLVAKKQRELGLLANEFLEDT